MGFRGPEEANFENVAALNRSWLTLLQRQTELRRGLEALPAELIERITNLTATEIKRLAKTPFLLFSFREDEDAYWTRMLAYERARDLFGVQQSADVETLVSAGLSFAWQLAQRNPYALRLTFGATVYWSERIAEQTVIELLEGFRATGDSPVIRLSHRPDLWRKLLGSGLSRQALASFTAQITALQTFLTDASAERPNTWSVATRKTATPQYRVAQAKKSKNN